LRNEKCRIKDNDPLIVGERGLRADGGNEYLLGLRSKPRTITGLRKRWKCGAGGRLWALLGVPVSRGDLVKTLIPDESREEKIEKSLQALP